MRHLDLFSGIGGFALGLRMAGGFETIGFCEIDPYCQKVLAKNFPGVPIYDDIKTLSYSDIRRQLVPIQPRKCREGMEEKQSAGNISSGELRGTQARREIVPAGPIDIITGGFPCQPFSVAGKQRGTADDRDLWPEMRRVIAEVRPAWVIGENVAGFVSMELDRSLSDLEALGYACRAFVVPACATDAPHRRDRVWIVGHSAGAGRHTAWGASEAVSEPGQEQRLAGSGRGSSAWTLADTSGEGREGRGGSKCADERQDGQAVSRSIHHETLADTRSGGQSGSREPLDAVNSAASEDGQAIKPLNGGRPCEWEPEPGMGRVANGIPRRVDRLRGLGNAVVPQVVCEIAKAILATERLAA